MKYLVGCLVMLFTYSGFADYINSYRRSNGINVQGFYRSDSNNTNHDNYSTSGNINPYKGDSRTRAQDYLTEAYGYGADQMIQTGI